MKIDQTEWHAPKGVPEDVEFLIRPLTLSQSTELREIESKHGVVSRQAYEKLIKHGLVDWRGFVDADDKPVPCSLANAFRLPGWLTDRVASEIYGRTFMSEYERKNLSSPSKSTGTGPASTAKPAPGAGTATKKTPRRSRSGSSRT